MDKISIISLVRQLYYVNDRKNRNFNANKVQEKLIWKLAILESQDNIESNEIRVIDAQRLF